MVSSYLSRRGFAIDAVACATDALRAIDCADYDALILDLGLPDMDGMDLLMQLRTRPAHRPPTLILTARDALEDRLRGLNGGADDYLVKPFDLTELEARLRAVLRRPGARAQTALSLGNLSLVADTRCVLVDGTTVALSRREFDCLEELLRAAPRWVVKDRLTDRLYSCDEPVTPNALEAMISRLRRTLIQSQALVHIETRRGIGYRITQKDHS